MTNEIINNLTRNNHLQRLLESFKNASDILIVSPFISNSFDFFPFKELKGIKRLRLVTTLKPKDLDQYSKVPFFKNLFEFCNKSKIELEILIENSLHGKVYISKYDNGKSEAIITSANFTNNGLRLNNEWGTKITSNEQILELENGILSKVILKPLTEKDIDRFIELIAKNPKKENKENPTSLDLSKKIDLKENPFFIEKNINYWLKPIGVSGDNISWDRVFDEIDSDLHFSKLKPKGVKKNDILICYAVGHSNILSIYKVKSEVKYTGNENDRWPYFVVGENLTPYYGQNWNSQGITITNEKNEVIRQGKFNVTPSGKNSFGSLMRGADKLRLTPEFGEYLINKIAKIDNEIKTKANNVYN
ncbi:restriction endonuclease PLD domain-containing protein [Psychroserpens algicola]|uniref:restriction endonuclease PLD domain-containing protein n=1 Tax=Psychroserpens algicola TaxID=1719034 RepID=UPI0019545E8B|nr:restriction endonuclease PLD domain-containing protein [Psychroserpens algicola]